MVLKLMRHFKTKVKTRWFFAAFAFSALSIYAITGANDNTQAFFPSLIPSAEAETAGHCALNPQKIAALKQSANGFFKNIRFADEAYDARKLSFKDVDGKPHTLAEFSGKTILVNLWAIWCIPCRTEMPELAHLKREFVGGEFDKMAPSRFDVVAINIDKTASNDKVQAFLKSVQADNLDFYRDESMDIFNEVRKDGLALGLPVTMLIDDQGCLLGSFNGSAPWGNADAIQLIQSAIEQASQAE